MYRQIKFVIWFPVVVAAALAAGWLVWQQTLIPGPYDLEPVSVIRHQALESQTTESLDTSDWKTYRNEKYGFGVKYPADWVKTEGKYSVIFLKNNLQDANHPYPLYISVKIYFDKNPEHLTIQQFLQNEHSECLERAGLVGEPQGCGELEDTDNWQKLVIDGKTALRSGKQNTEKGLMDSIYFLKDDVIIRIYEQGNQDDYALKPLVDQILSTFKFIEPKDKVCIQVITPARNQQTGEVSDFPTPCDVPEGWETIK